jgi:hypothetical protein
MTTAKVSVRPAQFEAAARAVARSPLRLAVAIAEPLIRLRHAGDLIAIDTARVRKLFIAVQGDVDRYIEG